MTFQAYLDAVKLAMNTVGGDHRAALFVTQQVDEPTDQQLMTFLGLLDGITNTETKKAGGAKSVAEVDARRQAIALLIQFVSTGPVTGAFSHLSRNVVCFELALRVRRPKIINQEETTLCGPVALVVDVAKRDPVRYVTSALQLFETGRAYWGTNEMAPGIVIRKGYKSLVPQADYLMLASVRDAWAIVLESDTIRDIFTLTKPGALCKFLEDAGYSDVVDRTFLNLSTSLNVLNAITPHPLYGQEHHSGDQGMNNLHLAENDISIGRSVIMNADGELSRIIGGSAPTPAPGPIQARDTHWTLLRKLSINPPNVSVRLITWGGSREKTIPLNVFLSYYCGYVGASPA